MNFVRCRLFPFLFILNVLKFPISDLLPLVPERPVNVPHRQRSTFQLRFSVMYSPLQLLLSHSLPLGIQFSLGTALLFPMNLGPIDIAH